MVEGEIVQGDGGKGDYAVTLPLSREGFGEFLSGLISTKRRLSFDIDHPLVIDRNLLVGIDRALKQRILVQNNAVLIQCAAEVILSDGSVYTEGCLDDILTIAPLDKVGTEGMFLEYAFAVFFNNSDTPQRQSIEIALGGIRHRQLTRDGGRSSKGDVVITYSERSWAEDIAYLLKRTFQSADRPEDKILTLPRGLRFLGEEIFLLPASILLIIAYAMVSMWLLEDPIISRANYLVNIQGDPVGLMTAVARSLSPIWLVSQILIFITVGVVFVAGFCIVNLKISDYTHLPNIVFDIYVEDGRLMAALKKERRRSTFSNIASFLVAILASVLAAYLFHFLSS